MAEPIDKAMIKELQAILKEDHGLNYSVAKAQVEGLKVMHYTLLKLRSGQLTINKKRNFKDETK